MTAQAVRGFGTWALVGAVCVLGLAALVDALSGAEPAKKASKPPPTRSTDETQPIRDELRRLDARGTITYADTRCGIHTVHLPELTAESAAVAPSCTFTMSPRNVWSPDATAISPRGDAVAVCLRSGGLQVRAADGSTVDFGPGCPPAWTPDGTLTVVRGGGVVRLEPVADGGFRSKPVLTRARLRRELFDTSWGKRAPFVREAAWLADDLVAVIVASRVDAGRDGLALFRDGKLVAPPLGPYTILAHLRPSPRGTYASAVIADGTGLVVGDARGKLVGIPIRSGQAIAWSPDETFGLVASPGGTTLFEPPTDANAVTGGVRLPFVARDLVWH